MSDYGWMVDFMQIEQIRGAIASVSLSHRLDCPCMTCRAADGDEDAFAEIVAMLTLDREHDADHP